MKNVTVPPRTVMAPRARQNQLIVLAVIVVLFVVLIKACAGHENKYENIARELTEAVQANDYAAAAKLENAETVAKMGHGGIGHASDVLTPLGKFQRIKEDTPADDGARVHEFAVTFEKGTVHEKIEFDPDDKVFSFDYHIVKPGS